MATTILRSTTSVRLRFLLDLTGLTSSSAGLIISTICDNEATPTVYTQAAGNIETITTLGTYAAPSSGKIRFREIDATNHPGLYEFQIADARLNVTNSRTMVITCSGAGLPATGIHYEIDLEGARNVRSVETAAANQIMGGLVTGSQPAGSLARAVRDIKSADVLFEGTIVSATTDKAILDAGATTVCVGQAISIGEEGDVERQTRFITAFNPDTKEITLDRQWCVIPPNGSDYQVKTLRNPLVGDKTKVLSGGYNEAIANSYTTLQTVFPPNFTDLVINTSGHIGRVTLVDTTTVNTDMRGTDNALVAADKTDIKNHVIVASQI